MKAIIDSGNDYIVAVKGNQPGLYAQCREIIESRPADDCDDRSNRAHGRTERRIVRLWQAPAAGDPLAINEQWIGIERILCVHRQRQVGTAYASDETTYYISSRTGDSAYALGTIIRAHWQIENRLHWVKDVQQNEDANRIRGVNAPKNISLLKTWVLSLFRLNGHDSIKNATITFANKIAPLMALMRT
jgi:predicted transposase YbfD/YdcC